MSEEEYIVALKTAAEDFISQIRQPDDGMRQTVERWEGLKLSLSAHTLRDLCDTWLASKARR